MKSTLLLLIVLCQTIGMSQSTFWQQTSYDSGSVRTLVANNAGIFALAGEYTIRSTDNGNTWTTCWGFLSVIAVGENNNIYSGVSYYMGRSTDNGTTWNAVFAPGTTVNIGSGFAASPLGIIIATYQYEGPGYRPDGLIRSTDSGSSWQVMSGFNAVYLAIQPSGVIFGVEGGVLYRSTDSGSSWISANSGLPSQVNSLAFLPGNRVLAGTELGVYCSQGGTGPWFNVGLDSIEIRTLTTNRDGGIYAGTNRGVYLATDSTLTWEQINTGLLDTSVTILSTDSIGFLYAVTSTAKIFRSRLTTTEAPLYNKQQPAFFCLSQNYPNPFNPNTTIQYELPHESWVVLNVYNSLGQLVRVLVDGVRDAGYRSEQFDASAFASGVYICRMTAKSTAGDRSQFQSVKKMILIR